MEKRKYPKYAKTIDDLNLMETSFRDRVLGPNADLVFNKPSVRLMLNTHNVPIYESNCIVLRTASAGNKYHQHAKFGYKNLWITGHRMGCFIQNGMDDEEQKQEASHRCGNSLCVQPEHMLWEPNNLNKTRQCCHEFYSDRTYKCPHPDPCFETLSSQKIKK